MNAKELVLEHKIERIMDIMRYVRDSDLKDRTDLQSQCDYVLDILLTLKQRLK